MTSSPKIGRRGDAILFIWEREGLEAGLDYFYEGHGEITAEVTVKKNTPPDPGLLHCARLNLMSSQSRSSLGKALGSRYKEMDWPGLLEQMCYIAVQVYREGAPTIDLRTVDPYEKPRWLLYPYVETGGPTILFAEGGTGKSTLALWMGVNVALGSRDLRGGVTESKPVLYLDYETTPEIHAERFGAICAGLGVEKEGRPPLYYRKMMTSLPQSAAIIRKEIDRLGAGLVIVDSLGAAGDGPPEEAATVIPLFTAINRLEVPTLCVHHKRKGTGKENARDRLFGSVYYANAARIVWDCEGVVDPVLDKVTLGLTNVKINNGKPLPKHALELLYVNRNDRLESVTIKKVDLMKVEDLARKAPMRDRIISELSGGAKSIGELVESLDAEETSVKARITELRRRGEVVNLADHTWGLVSREEE